MSGHVDRAAPPGGPPRTALLEDGAPSGAAQTASTAPYLAQAYAHVAEALSLQDREACSVTYGCFDRVYWAWKFTDFPGARFQEGVYTLAHLYATPFEGNILAGRAEVLAWIDAGLAYWQSIQYRDGSFDEAYPWEHSLAATAFTGFYLGEALRLVGDRLPAERLASLRLSCARAADWLCANDERHGVLSNHLAAAAAALQVTGDLADVSRYRARAQHFVERILARQSPEGWYEEYGGADPGYQTHGTFYLARLWQLTGDERLLASLRRSVAFLAHFVHPNGTLGGEYGSRNTEFSFPAGFEILAEVSPDAALIAAALRASAARQTTAGLAAMDAYNFFPMLNNYLVAAANARALPEGVGQLPCEGVGSWVFPDAGLVVRATPAYYAVVGLSKGGVVKVYDRRIGALALSDCGYWARLSDGRVVSSQTLQRPYVARTEEETWTVETGFVQVNQRVQTPWTFLGFRLFNLTLGRFQRAAYWFKQLLVKVLVQRRRPAPLRLRRRIRLTPGSVVIEDALHFAHGVRLGALAADPKFATIHMGSARYFQAQELSLAWNPSARLASMTTEQGGSVLHFQRVWPTAEGKR